MKILGIETSCDETAICLIEDEGDFSNGSVKILGNQLYSQIELHAKYGGVFPMMAKREHAKNLTPLLEKCLDEADLLKHSTPELSLEKVKKIKEILLAGGFTKFRRATQTPFNIIYEARP